MDEDTISNDFESMSTSTLKKKLVVLKQMMTNTTFLEVITADSLKNTKKRIKLIEKTIKDRTTDDSDEEEEDGGEFDFDEEDPKKQEKVGWKFEFVEKVISLHFGRR